MRPVSQHGLSLISSLRTLNFNALKTLCYFLMHGIVVTELFIANSGRFLRFSFTADRGKVDCRVDCQGVSNALYDDDDIYL